MFFTFASSAVESSGLSVCRFMNPLCDAALCRSAPIHHTLQFYAKCEQRSFCSAQNPTSFGVKLAYGVVFAGNSPKEKARNFSVNQEVSGFVLLKLGIYCSIGFIVGTGQGRRKAGPERLGHTGVTDVDTPPRAARGQEILEFIFSVQGQRNAGPSAEPPHTV